MPLKLRPTGLGSGAYQDNIDYNIFSGEWLIGRIYERNGFPDEVRFFWSLHGVGVATWSVAAYVAICFVAPMRPLLERLLLTYAVGAIWRDVNKRPFRPSALFAIAESAVLHRDYRRTSRRRRAYISAN